MVFVMTLTDTLHRIYNIRNIVVLKTYFTDQINHTEEIMLLEKVWQLLLNIYTHDSMIETIQSLLLPFIKNVFKSFTDYKGTLLDSVLEQLSCQILIKAWKVDADLDS